MALSVYVHIPYCLQRCRYCDFTTFVWSEIMPPEQYVGWLIQEIRNRRAAWPQTEIQTVYFGGGTPSLIAPELIVSVCQELANAGFKFRPDVEMTIEINPATMSEKNLMVYLDAGFNRFSVGAQSFNDRLLQACGRKHNAQDTRNTLKLLQQHGLNYSFDLLFALPGQTREDLARDLEEVAAFAPPHLSAYCLTVPEGHPMSFGRPPEDEQVEMFDQIETQLKRIGIFRYEISNFARPGFESRHNMAYWRDVSYWGLGLSSHSYAREQGDYGVRFWNPKSFVEYERQLDIAEVPAEQREHLARHEALTDFCHMFLRTTSGLPKEALQNKFGGEVFPLVEPRLETLKTAGLLISTANGWTLSDRGLLLSNKVFEELTFLAEELAPGGLTPTTTDSYCSV